MTKEEEHKLFGLLGKNIAYSFSRGYFSEKFTKLNLSHRYVNFDISQIEEFNTVIADNKNLKGLNVTIPYKQEVIPYLNKVDKTARKIGAVNTIKFTKRGNLKGYNSDAVGFEKSLLPMLEKQHQKALILGTGGASKAVAYVLEKNDIKFKFVSRNPTQKNQIAYDSLNQELLEKYTIIINSTPVGTSPEIDKCPDIPYQFINKNHLLYDLIYNPEITTFLAKGKNNGAKIKNGFEMLTLQAEESWRIWNS